MDNGKKPAGVNKGIQEGMSPEQFQGRVICKKCGKDIEFTLGSELFKKCPRCGFAVERQMKKEEKLAGKIIKWDIMRRSKRVMLQMGSFLTVLALAYNIIGFFTGLFGRFWWLALMSLPLVVGAYFCMRVTRKKSAAKFYRFLAWLSMGLVVLALIVIIVTAIPEFNRAAAEWLDENTAIDVG